MSRKSVFCHFYLCIILWSSLRLLRSWYRSWNHAAYHHWENTNCNIWSFLKIVLFEKDVQWGRGGVTQHPCDQQGYDYRLNIRWTRKRKTAARAEDWNTPHCCQHESQQPRAVWFVFMWLFTLLDQLRRRRIHRQTHTVADIMFEPVCLWLGFITVDTQATCLNVEGPDSINLCAKLFLSTGRQWSQLLLLLYVFMFIL